MTLRELRVWHWKRAIEQTPIITRVMRRHPNKYRNHGSWMVAHERHILHMSAVQALNDVLDGTAEQDEHAQRT